ncbi:MAG: hypothetical protein HZY73_12565 [Micropruina sp.]|nr:MAG: hypothetical protein HZY73_12565 [Micropruina sp.]
MLDQMSLPAARQVHEAWVLPGGPGFEDWSLTADVRAFLASGRQDGQAKDDTTVVVTTPKAAIVKGVDGPDWAVVCVLLDVQVSIHTDARMGYGLCAAMQWSQDRWQVATGPEPAPALRLARLPTGR